MGKFLAPSVGCVEVYLSDVGVIMFPLLLAQITPVQQTIVNQVGQEFFIEGGEFNGANLFHSFQQFGLTDSQIATFLANPELQNILVRVVNRREPSFIDGLLQISGGSPNLFFISPSGVVFGENAQVNVPASFVVGTATSIDFPDVRWSTSKFEGATSALSPKDLVFSFVVNNPVINLGQIQAGDQVFFAGRNVQSFGSVTAKDFTAVTLGTSIFTIAVSLESGQTLNLNCQTLNLNCQTLNLNRQTLNLNCQTLNLNRQTFNLNR